MNINEILNIKQSMPIFTEDIDGDYDDVYKELKKLENQGVIKEYQKNIFYRPKMSRFGEIGLDKDKLIERLYIANNGTIYGYITGSILFYNLGLTTQVPNVKTIITNNASTSFKDDNLKIVVIKSEIKIDKDILDYLKFLDILEFFTEIQDINLDRYNNYVNNKIDSFKTKDIKILKTLIIHYSNGTQTLFNNITKIKDF